MSDLYENLDFSSPVDLQSTPDDTGDDSYNYYTNGNGLGNLSNDTGLSFIQNAENPAASIQSLLYGGTPVDPSQSLTPNSAQEASPSLFSQLFGGTGKALSTPATANQSSLGQLFGNLASRLIQPLAQGATNNPTTNNINTTPSTTMSIASLLSNPLVLIGGGILLYLMLKK